MRRRNSIALRLALVTGIAALAAACASNDAPPRPAEAPRAPAPAAAAPPAYDVARLVGRWGVASFHQADARARTEREARAQCSQPYVITKGPTDGVMMHVADDAKLYELTLKGAADGKTYLGFDAPPGHPQDREIISFTEPFLVMRFVDPEVHRRYGTFIFFRCGG